MNKGFAPPKKQLIQRDCYQPYTAELKRRYLTDNSELLCGTAEILIPKRLYDPIGKCSKREVWDCFATAIAYHLLHCSESQKHGVNQVFIFDNRIRLIERVEANSWTEENSESGEAKEIENSNWELIQSAATQCQLNINWLRVPQIC